MKTLASLASLFLLLTACAPTGGAPPETAEHHIVQAEKYMESKLYEQAITAWEKVRDSYYSPELNILAEMKIADTHFLAKDYIEAAAAYEDFLKQHPDHEKTPTILFQLGRSYYEQILSVDRDQTATRMALATFKNLLRRYPEDPAADKAQAFIARCTDRLAAHELYVGRFYLRTGNYDSAVRRLQNIPSRFPETRHRDAALFYLGKAYLELGEHAEAKRTLEALSRDFPASEHLDEARRILQQSL